MAKSKKKERRVSCLGVLLILCMLLIAGVTASVNLLLNDGKMLHVSDQYYFYYDRDDMGSTIPKGSFVIAEEAKNVEEMNAVIYRATNGANRIGIVSLKRDRAEDGTAGSAVYYLTTISDREAIAVSPSDIIGVCKQKNKELGTIIGFLLTMTGMICCLILPCFILLLYLIAAMISARESAKEEDAEDEADIEFVKSIQQRQAKAAQRDAQRLEEHKPAAAKAQPPVEMLDEEQMQREEEEEAARRAERIAAVRSHMETRRETETPDGVPLYTTEIITRTHTMPIPKTGTEKLTTTQQRAAVKLSATGKLQTESTVRQTVKPEHTSPALSEPERLPVHPKKTAAPAPAEQPAPAVKPQAKAAAPVRQEAPKPATQPAPAEDPATFDEIWAMLEAEEKKLQ